MKNVYLGLRGRRVYNMGDNVNVWNEKTGEPSSSWDVCILDAEKLDKNPHYFDHILVPYGDKGEPNGDEGRGGDAEHPSYEEMDPEDRKCAICAVDLIDD